MITFVSCRYGPFVGLFWTVRKTAIGNRESAMESETSGLAHRETADVKRESPMFSLITKFGSLNRKFAYALRLRVAKGFAGGTRTSRQSLPAVA